MNGLLIAVISGLIVGIIVTFINLLIMKKINKKNKEERAFESIYLEFEKIVNYRKGTQHEDVTENTSKISSLCSRIKSKKYNDILPEIKEFGKKYKDSIPPGGAKSPAAKKRREFWQKAEDLSNKIEKKINED